MNYLDLFSGIGGFSMAIKKSGIEINKHYYSEIDKNAIRVYKKYYPEAIALGNIKSIKYENIEQGKYILSAGFPCQDASIAGKREGLNGSETGLFHELARIINEIKPEWFILENVPGLLSVNKGRDMAFIIQVLSEIGYCVCWKIFDARYFGVAQRRRRLWIVGSFGDTRSVEVLFEQEGSRRNDKTEQQVGARGLCISTRDGEWQDPTGETLIASTVGTNDNYRANARTNRNLIAKTIMSKCGDRFNSDENLVANTIGATERGNTSFVWQDTYIAETNADREREIDGLS